jgi:serine/threonine-protein kinase
VTCPHCKTPLVEGARFCPACGQAAAPTESGSGWQARGVPDITGREIAGRYRIIKKLGEGGMGAVYRGEQISLKRAVAVKLLRPELGSNQLILRRFNAEAEAVAKLSHPNTVNIFDFGQDTDGSLFIAMEYIEGRSLREALQRDGAIPSQRALAIALQVAASLSDAHAHSIVHRDLKPDNVMLQDRGKQKDVVRVLDFGIAKLRDDSRATQMAMTQDGDMLGTPQYMAPEQIKGESIDGRTDIYALGCLIYEMVTARLPYEAPSIMAMLSKHLLEDVVPPSQRRPDLALPPAIDQLVAAAMAKEPSARPETMEQFAELISGLMVSMPRDPNRSGPVPLVAMQPGGAPGAMLTPAAPSSYGPAPTPQNVGGFGPYAPPSGPYMPGGPAQPYSPAQGYGHPQIAPTAMIGQGDRPRTSRAPLFAILAVLVLGGGAVAAWQLTKKDDTPTVAASEPAKDPEPKKEPEPAHTPGGDDTTPPQHDDHGATPDPWGDSDPAPDTTLKTPPKATTGTAMMPIPKGATIIPPPGFTKVQGDANTLAYVHTGRGLAIGMASLYGGTNDPDELAKKYVEETGVTFVQKTQGFSAGNTRQVLIFSSEVNGVAVLQTAVLYIGPKYRLAVLYQAPVVTWQDEAFQKEVDAFFINNIKLP